MGGFEGSLALKLDFGERATLVTSTGGRGRAGLRLATTGRLTGPDKYRQLEERRRHAQISARRLLDVMEGEE